ncbi:MAG: hypothetical protein K6G18_09570 [Treponema sp.]|nr:hypothetical protein [Treponema sp.]MCR5622091.1 hypothetical protein [Treponema sp.]
MGRKVQMVWDGAFTVPVCRVARRMCWDGTDHYDASDKVNVLWLVYDGP